MSAPVRTKPVTVVFVGDARAGKTSLITAAATETFSRSPPPCLPPTRLPADATLEGVPLTLVDTSSRDEDRAATDAALRSADVIVLCFDPSKSKRDVEREREKKKWGRTRGRKKRLREA